MCWLTRSDSSSLPIYGPSIRWDSQEPQDKGKQLPNWRIHSYAQQLQCRPQEAVGNKQYCLCVTWLPGKWKQALHSKHRHLCHWGQPYIRFWSMAVTWSIVSASSSITSPTCLLPQRNLWGITHLILCLKHPFIHLIFLGSYLQLTSQTNLQFARLTFPNWWAVCQAYPLKHTVH